MIKFNTTIKNSDVSIIMEVAPENFGRFNAFDVRVLCDPPYHDSDKGLMIEVCRILTEQSKGEVRLKTYYVVRDVNYAPLFRVEEITFQVITSLEPQWHC